MDAFESESTIEERRKQRQEEWEKVRSADQPELAPEEPYDGRSLYDRLKEQRDAKDSEFEEARKFKNMIRGLDDDDVDHLTQVDDRKMLEERKQMEEEQNELNDFRAKVAELQEQSADQKLNEIVSKPKSKAPATVSRSTSQKAMISSVVKRKSDVSAQEPPQKRVTVQPTSALRTYAVLPGIGDYKSSDDSDASSDEELEEIARTDLTGRQLKKKCQEE